MRFIIFFASICYILNYSCFSQSCGGVELLSLQAEILSELDACGRNIFPVKITWITATVQNIDYFQVERGAVPTSVTVLNPRVPADGNSSMPKTYSFIDYAPNLGDNYYRITAVDLCGDFVLSSNFVSINISVPNRDFKNQGNAIYVQVASTPDNPDSYQWNEMSNQIQGIHINVIPTERLNIYFQQNNALINFTTRNSDESANFFMINLDINADNIGWINIYNGSIKQDILWSNAQSFFGSIGQHNLKVLWTDNIGNNFFREYDIFTTPASQKLFEDNYCNTMRLWESNASTNAIPVILSEGFDAYNTKPEEYYREAGKELFDCLLTKGFKIYVLNYRFNSQDIRNNAAIFSSAVKFISNINNNQPVVATGISMGGIIARYAVTKAEHDGLPLPVSKLVTIDSPHQGAVISQQLQDFRKNKTQGDSFAEHALNNPAAKQLLTYNAYDPSGSVHNTFYSELNNLNGDGYPHLIENIGVTFSTNTPNPNLGDWLKVEVSPPFGGQSVTFPLTSELLVPGSYLPRVNVDPVVVGPGNYWGLNLLVIPQPFLYPTVSITQYSDPTFIPHTSSLDIVNGQSKFDLTIIPFVTGYHDVVPSEIIDPLVNALITDNVYLQNKTITDARTYIGRKTITAGNNVNPNPNIPTGDFVIEVGANVTFKAGEEIRLKPGFHAKAVSNFHAFITSPVTSCDGSIENQMKISNTQPIIQVPSIENLDIKTIKANVFQQHTFIISPNLTTGIFSIRSSEKISQLEIINLLGETILSSPMGGGREGAFDLSSHPKGIYFIKVITSNGQSFVEKVVIQ